MKIDFGDSKYKIELKANTPFVYIIKILAPTSIRLHNDWSPSKPFEENKKAKGYPAKIGNSNNLSTRLDNLLTNIPYPVKIYIIGLQNVKYNNRAKGAYSSIKYVGERILHDMFKRLNLRKNWRVGNEWFLCIDELEKFLNEVEWKKARLRRKGKLGIGNLFSQYAHYSEVRKYLKD